MTNPRIDNVKAVLDFDSWREAAAGREQLFVQNHRIGDLAPPELELANPRAAAGPAGLGSSHAVLRAPGDVRVRLDVFELESHPAALDLLAELASEFELPTRIGTELQRIGEVCVAVPSGVWLGFARGNLVVRLMQDGSLADLEALARRIDEALMEKPAVSTAAHEDEDIGLADLAPAAEARLAPAFAPAGRRAAASGPLVAGLPPGRSSLKIFSTGGSICAEDGLLVVPEGGEEVKMDIYTTGVGGGAEHRHLTWRATPKRSATGSGKGGKQ